MRDPGLLPPPAGRGGRGCGFTLVELLVVLTIMALVASLTPWAWDRWQAGADYRDTVRRIHEGLLQARARAQAQHQPVAYVFDLERNRHGAWVPGESQPRWTGPWPTSLQVQVTVAAGVVPEPWLGVWFLPDGGGTGGTIRVLRGPGDGTAVRVDWLTGRVQLLAIEG